MWLRVFVAVEKAHFGFEK